MAIFKLKINYLAVLMAITLILGALGLKSEKTQAQAVLPIGGPIVAVYYCCNGVMLTLGAPTPGTYMYYWGTPLFAHYNVWEPGPYVLGRGGTPGVCSIPTAFPPCAYVTATTGFFTMVGTSGL